MKKASLSPHQLFFSLGQPNSRNYLPFLLFPSLLFPSLIPNIVLKSIQISKNYYYYFKEYLIREVTILEHINLVITFIKPLRGRTISIKLRRSLWNIPVIYLFIFSPFKNKELHITFFLINKKGERTKEIVIDLMVALPRLYHSSYSIYWGTNTWEAYRQRVGRKR